MKRIDPAIRLASIYALFGILWILGSDAMVNQVANGNAQLYSKFQQLKGLLFVGLSSLLLYAVAHRMYKSLHHSFRESNALLLKYRIINENTTDCVVDYHLEEDIAEINDLLRKVMQLPEGPVKGYQQLLLQRIHPDDRERVIKNFQAVLNSGADVWHGEYRMLWNDDSYHHVVSRGYIMRTAETGQPERYIVLMNDVTELRNMKAVYFEQEIRHRQVLGRSIVQAQEEERNRWAQELHDNVCQLLTVAKLYLEQSSVQQPQLMADKAKDMIARALNDIRQLSTSMKPPEFSQLTLEEAIDNLIANVVQIKPIDFRTEYNKLQTALLSNDHKLMVYRIVQEQLQNIIKYAQARQVAITLSQTNGHMYVSIADDGVGFDLQKVKSGIGLRNIRNRLQVFQGQLQIEAAPSKGCKLTATFSVS